MGKQYLGVHPDIKVKGRWIQTYTDASGWYTTRAGGLWRALLTRNINKSYNNIKIGFQDFYEFCDWCQTQEEYFLQDESNERYQIDKDLLGDALTYNTESCCFIPRHLNAIMQGVGSMKRGELVGSSYDTVRKNWRSYIVEDNVQINLGRFKTEAEAHSCWKTNKANRIEVAFKKYKFCDRIQQGFIKLIKDMRC